MASEQNGSYASYQSPGYGLADQNYATHSINNTALADINGTSAPAPSTNGVSSGSTEVPQDQVGWYFVEQYYTTLSKNPEKLFLFYNKRSQFVSGKETEKCPVCVGQKAINDRIMELDFQDCKVRVTNVDSQGSGQNIIIQVIGEISNKSTPQRKFTQTFVLAEQLNGYFVLNDIFRYIIDDEEEAVDGEEPEASQTEAATGNQESTPLDEETLPGTLTSSEDSAAQEHDASLVDKQLEEVIKEDAVTEKASAEEVVDEPAAESVELAEPTPVEETPAEVEAADDENVDVPDMEDIKAEDLAQTEKPKAPEPTPLPSPPKAAAQPAAVATTKPALPKTWANLVAGNKLVAAALPAISAAVAAVTPSAPAPQPKAAPAATAPPAQSQSNPSPVAAPASTVTPVAPDTEQASGSGWQTAGHDHSKKQARPQSAPNVVDGHRGYIKNVSDSIDANALRTHLTKIAEVTYFDVNRQKNCAFVDFSSPAGYQAAVAANPHEVSGERLYLEERRIRPGGNFPGGFAPGRGGAARGGRGGAENRNGTGGRGGFQKEGGGRGNFPSRGRGGASRGRGGAAPTA